MPLTIEGNDNRGKPRQLFADTIADLTDQQFVDVAKKKIWLSAYASNNPRSDYHWQADACHDEAERRDNPALYKQAYDRAVASVA